MTRTHTAALTLGRLAAAALALAAGSSQASATLNITSFAVSTDGVPFVSPKYAWASDPTTDLTVAARNAGGLYGAADNSYSASIWEYSNNVVAQTSAASAFANAINFTDGMTGLNTGGFNLVTSAAVQSFPLASPPSTGTASALQTGGFTLLDGNGDAISGTITFDVYYEISITGPAPGSALDFSMATLTLSGYDADGSSSFTNQLNSASLTGGTGAITGGHFTMSFALAAGEVASYSLSATSMSSATAVAVPEPSTLAFSAFGLALVGMAARRGRRMKAQD